MRNYDSLSRPLFGGHLSMCKVGHLETTYVQGSTDSALNEGAFRSNEFGERTSSQAIGSEKCVPSNIETDRYTRQKVEESQELLEDKDGYYIRAIPCRLTVVALLDHDEQ
ncbi:hypothetical protein TMatcc_004408 [Talaromyces marneffei ATCC 18224]